MDILSIAGAFYVGLSLIDDGLHIVIRILEALLGEKKKEAGMYGRDETGKPD